MDTVHTDARCADNLLAKLSDAERECDAWKSQTREHIREYMSQDPDLRARELSDMNGVLQAELDLSKMQNERLRRDTIVTRIVPGSIMLGFYGAITRRYIQAFALVVAVNVRMLDVQLVVIDTNRRLSRLWFPHGERCRVIRA